MDRKTTLRIEKNPVNSKIDLDKIQAKVGAAGVEYFQQLGTIRNTDAMIQVLECELRMDNALLSNCSAGARLTRLATSNECLAYGLPTYAISEAHIDADGNTCRHFLLPEDDPFFA